MSDKSPGASVVIQRLEKKSRYHRGGSSLSRRQSVEGSGGLERPRPVVVASGEKREANLDFPYLILSPADWWGFFCFRGDGDALGQTTLQRS